MGRFDDGKDLVFYLSAGEGMYSVKPGDNVGAEYKLLRVDAQQLIFEHLPTSTQQSLLIESMSN
jgi:hypothetical protein